MPRTGIPTYHYPNHTQEKKGVNIGEISQVIYWVTRPLILPAPVNVGGPSVRRWSVLLAHAGRVVGRHDRVVLLDGRVRRRVAHR